MHLIGVTIGIAGTWYIAAWVLGGARPLTQQPNMLPYGPPEGPVVPPQWILGVTGVLTLVGLCFVLVGTQENNPKVEKKRKM